MLGVCRLRENLQKYAFLPLRYRPDRVRPFSANLEEYRRLVALQAPQVDLFICETMSTAEEARAAAKLDHDHVARVYHCGEDQGLHFIAFEFKAL